MNVLFDCRYVRLERHDGISRFSAELVTRLARLVDVTMLISDERQRSMLPELPWILGPSPTSVLEPLTSLRLPTREFDVIYSPMQMIGGLGRNCALVNTVHDLIYYRHPEPPKNLPAAVRLGWRLYHKSFVPQRMMLSGADATVVVSETTARLVAEHRLTNKPVSVVRNAADALGIPVSSGAPLSKRLIYMGSFMPYKGVDTLVRMMRHLPEYELHLLGRIAPDEESRLRALEPRAHVTFHNGVSDAEYGNLLTGATALVHASHDEGFGIPLLESMMLGIPVVVSDIPIFHEVAGDAGLFATAGDAEAFATRVRALEGEWAARSYASKQQASLFSWEASAAALHTALQDAVQARARGSRPPL